MSKFLVAKKFFENKHDSGLLYDAEIEYLEGTGTQYIEPMEIIPNENMGIHMYSISSNNDDRYILGMKETSGNTRWSIGHNSTGMYYGYGTYAYGISGNIAESFLNWMNNKKFITINGNNSSTLDLPALSFTPTYSIRIFGWRGVNSNIWAGKIYYVQISHKNKIIADFIPVRIGNTGHLYNKINKKILWRHGAGEFLLGPDI